MSKARQVANFDPALFAADEVSGDKVSGGTIGAGTIGGTSIINTSGAITTTGTATFSGDLVPATPLSHRNMIINGGMNVYQRGSLAITTTNNGGYALDRFSYYQTGAGQYAGTMSQHSMTDPEVITTGHTTALKIDTGTAESAIDSADYGALVYKVEAQDCQRMCAGRTNAKAVTLSFWANSSVAGDYAVSMYQQDGDEIIGNKFTLVADTWTKVEITFAGNTSTNIDDNNDLGLMIKWFLFAGSNWTSSDNTSWGASANAKIAYGHTGAWGLNASHNFYITGVQLELGSSATPFEHRSYGDELSRCQRYYQAGPPSGDAARVYLFPVDHSSDYRRGMIFFKSSMRSAPALTVTGVGGYQWAGTEHTALFTNGVPDGNSDDATSWVATAEL